MTDPSPDNETSDNPLAASIEPQVSPGSPQPDCLCGWMAPATLKSEDTLGIDGDETLCSHSSNDLRASPGLPSCTTKEVTTEAAQTSAKHFFRVDRLGVTRPSSTASARLPSGDFETPLDDEESDLHAALVDEMKAHPGEGPLGSWLYSIQVLYTNASDKFAVNKAKIPIERQRYSA